MIRGTIMDYDKLEIETAFKDGDMIPIKYTGYGKNISPVSYTHLTLPTI